MAEAARANAVAKEPGPTSCWAVARDCATTFVGWHLRRGLRYVFSAAAATRREWHRDESDLRASLRFLLDRSLPVGFLTRLWLVERFVRISHYIECAHRNSEMLEVATAILRVPSHVPGVIVEAGAYRGGSAAKLSLCAQLVGRKLVVFDSFEGIPENSEIQAIGSQQGVMFKAGWYAGSVEQVRSAIDRFGCLDICELVQGWFSHTMPSFMATVAVAYLDVDLVSSTRDCLIGLYPRLAPGGTLFSQDAHLSKIIELFEEDAFWRNEVGVEKPQIRGLRTRKLISTTKTA